MRVQCTNHSKPWKIASFNKGLHGDDWMEHTAATKARRIEQQRKKAELDAKPARAAAAALNIDEWIEDVVPAGDKPVHVTRLVDGEPKDLVESLRDSMPSLRHEEWKTYDLTCPRCKRKKRHATYRRREDALFQTFDELVGLGITKVTPEFLHKYETRRDADNLAE